MHLIVADLHGSVSAAEALKQIVAEKRPEAILLLGDILRGAGDEDNYHVANVLKALPCGLIAVKGNCDYMSDRYALNHDLPLERTIDLYGWRIHMQHYPYACSLSPYSIFLYGHTHRKELASSNGGIICNPGSLSYPRDGSRSFAELDQNGIRLILAEDGSVISEIPFLNVPLSK
jgi:putative phosphoesterase